VGREPRAADVAHPARGARRVRVGAVVAVPLADAGAVSQLPRPEPAPLRAPAEAGSAAAERKPPASRPSGVAAGDASRARRGRGVAQMPRPVPQPASDPAAREDGGVQAAPQHEQRGEKRRRPEELVQPRRVQRAMLRHRQIRLQPPRRGGRGHGARQDESEQGQHGHGCGRGEVSEEHQQDWCAEEQGGRGGERLMSEPRPSSRGGLPCWPALVQRSGAERDRPEGRLRARSATVAHGAFGPAPTRGAACCAAGGGDGVCERGRFLPRTGVGAAGVLIASGFSQALRGEPGVGTSPADQDRERG